MKLYVFDFDNTLFASPTPPKDWQGPWWSIDVSLIPPVVPELPDMSWWNTEIIEKVKESVEASNGYVILLTGRKEKEFKNRVYQLLDQVGIKKYFDFIGLNDGGETIDAKIRYLNRFLNKDPRINEVEFWDDRKIHVQPFKEWAARNNLICIHHLVEAVKKEPEALP
jgi:predicted phosphatase